MIRLLKLVLGGLIGYAVYELIRGMISGDDGGQDRGQVGSPSGPGSRALNRALNRDSGRANITGGGRGERVVTSDATGEAVPHMIGRGVVRR
ncbi:MAG TPA: hypothetical protein VIM11_04860 [Tepidisphaeraceae bacterium]